MEGEQKAIRVYKHATAAVWKPGGAACNVCRKVFRDQETLKAHKQQGCSPDKPGEQYYMKLL